MKKFLLLLLFVPFAFATAQVSRVDWSRYTGEDTARIPAAYGIKVKFLKLPDGTVLTSGSSFLQSLNKTGTGLAVSPTSGAAKIRLVKTEIDTLASEVKNAINFSNAGNAFVGSGSGLSSLNASNISSGTVGSGFINGNYSSQTRWLHIANDYFGDTLSVNYLIGNGAGIISIPISGVTGMQDSLNNKQNRGENYAIGAARGTSLTPSGTSGQFGWFKRNATAPQSGTVSLTTSADTAIIDYRIVSSGGYGTSFLNSDGSLFRISHLESTDDQYLSSPNNLFSWAFNVGQTALRSPVKAGVHRWMIQLESGYVPVSDTTSHQTELYIQFAPKNGGFRRFLEAAWDTLTGNGDWKISHGYGTGSGMPESFIELSRNGRTQRFWIANNPYFAASLTGNPNLVEANFGTSSYVVISNFLQDNSGSWRLVESGNSWLGKHRIGGSATRFALFDSAKVEGDSLLYYIGGTGYVAPKKTGFDSIFIFLIVGAGLHLFWTNRRKFHIGVLVLCLAIPLSARQAKKDSTITLSVSKIDSLINLANQQVQTNQQNAQTYTQMANEAAGNALLWQARLEAWRNIKTDSTLQVRKKK